MDSKDTHILQDDTLIQEAAVCCSSYSLTAGGSVVQRLAQSPHSKKVLSWILCLHVDPCGFFQEVISRSKNVQTRERVVITLL